MLKTKDLVRISVVLASLAILSSGCGYRLKYRLNDRDIVKAKSTAPFNVQVAIFSDERNSAEKEKSARKKQGFKDAGDYTYDKEFRGTVSEELSKMLVSHLEYSGSFSEIELSQFTSEEISEDLLKKLQAQNVDAVLVGSIANFYGYYDNKPGKQLLYGFGLGMAVGLPIALATTSTERTDVGFGTFEETKINPVAVSLGTSLGASLGYYIESTSQRDTEARSKISARLLSTSSHEVLWEDTFEIYPKAHRSMPGINTQQRKFELAVGSLREAVNKMVESLGEKPLVSEKK